tara:strand:+ start:1667 stop:2404 length:738 start_codon:yes stop_codon:yes gene_type:complete
MKNNIPKLLKDSIEQNSYDIDIITQKLKLPWLKLDLSFDAPSTEDLAGLYSTNDWRDKWQFKNNSDNAYQIKGWNGDLYFGPSNFEKFLEMIAEQSEAHKHDEDSKCRTLRSHTDFSWYVDRDNYIRQQVEKIVPNESDLNLVNTYSLPPGGYVFPHRDYALDDMGLAKIYVALKWSNRNEFGMYGCGNIPIQEGDIFLLNNYTLPHWVYNGSQENRIVVDISANLHSPKIKEAIVSSFKKSFSG